MSGSDSDQTGFVELYKSPDALIDIVFVHGLRGYREDTWTEGTTLWPKELLPEKVPQARILTFGYDADIYHFWSKPASDNSIKNHADDLTDGLSGLRHKEEQTGTRPIIFVAHSLGGLVCAEALSNAEDSLQPHIKHISDYTRRIAFLGTPHRGSDKAKWVESGKNFLSLFSMKTTGGILKELEQGSDTLVKLGFEFPRWLSHRAGKPETKVEIVCFFEELSSSVNSISIGKIVPEESAKLVDYPTLSIRADHRGMCKFSDAKDGNYRRVADVLERWAKELKEETKEEDTETPGKYISKPKFGDHNQGNQFGFFKSKGSTNFGSSGTLNMNSS